jgi:serine/threonine protein kinase
VVNELICPRCRIQGPGPQCALDGVYLVTQEALQGAPHDGLLGSLVDGRYAITERLGVGGMGAVYRAQDLSENRTVAIKFLLDRYANHPALRQRFVREAEAAAAVQSPYVVPLTDFGVSPEGTLWMVMEYVQGWTLRDEVNRRGPLEVDVAIRFCRQVLLGLEAIHEAGLVHRDLKHDNVMFVGTRRRFVARVLDFGVVKSAIAEVQGREGQGLVTGTGVLVGSPSYMAPEQVRGLAIGPPADLYSLGVILWEAMAGRRLFTNSDYESLLEAGARRDAPLLLQTGSGAAVPNGFARLLVRALAHDPADRFADARTMLLALDQIGHVAEPLPEELLADPTPNVLILSAPTLLPDDVLTPIVTSPPLQPEPTPVGVVQPRWIKAVAFVGVATLGWLLTYSVLGWVG